MRSTICSSSSRGREEEEEEGRRGSDDGGGKEEEDGVVAVVVTEAIATRRSLSRQLVVLVVAVVVVFGLLYCFQQQRQQNVLRHYHYYDYHQQQHQQQQQQQQRRILLETTQAITNGKVVDDLQRTSLFHVSEQEGIKTIGPTIFPKPTDIYLSSTSTTTTTTNGNIDVNLNSDNIEIVTLFEPIIGKRYHNISKNNQKKRNMDAIFIFAAEYNLNTYILFLSTLKSTGYIGDVVIAIAKSDYNDMSIRSYLESFDTKDDDDDDNNKMNVIVYVLDGLQCYNAEMEKVDGMKGGMRVCNIHNLYGYRKKENVDDNGKDVDSTVHPIVPLNDPRPPRTVPTTRYELYWIWIQYYSVTSWIMLIDARDTIFQSNPFNNVPRRNNDVSHGGGKLYFFGENIDATRIGQSKKNAKWLLHSYGQSVVNALKDKPTICSGSTMGESIAIETYLRAMINEFDETNIKLMGVDQGYHNYLYYSNKLSNSISTISSITVFNQGYGIINNLGAMRTKELNEWGNGKLLQYDNSSSGTTRIPKVYNWDGTLSPVAHQFDRHKVLSEYWYKTKTNQYRQEWLMLLKSSKKNKKI